MNTFDKMVAFAKKRFVDATAEDHLEKLKIEADEASKDLTDISEFADCLLALYAAAGKAGHTEGQLNSAAEQKFKILKKRKWEKLPGKGIYQHKPD